MSRVLYKKLSINLTVLLECIGILCQFSKPDWFLETCELPRQGHSKWPGWSGFSRTTLSQGKNKIPFYKSN